MPALRRRAFITLLGGAAAAWPLAARAQQPGKLPLVGVLVSASPPHPFADALRRGLQNLGYSEGRNIALEVRYRGAQRPRRRDRRRVRAAQGRCHCYRGNHGSGGQGGSCLWFGPSASTYPLRRSPTWLSITPCSRPRWRVMLG